MPTVSHLQKRPDSSTIATLGGTTCPVCGHEVARAINTGDYQLYNCPHCTSWCSDALMGGAQSSFTYDTNYFGNADADRGKWSDLLRTLSKVKPNPSSLLDVGCGSGAFLSYARSYYPAVPMEGLEINPEYAKLAMGANPDMRIHVGDAHELLENTGNKFDIITLWDVFEHLSEPKRLLHALSNLLNDGGYLFIQTINEHSIVPFLGRMSYHLTCGLLRSIVRRTHEPHHLVFYSEKGLSMLAREEGLQVHSFTYDRLSHDRMDGHPLVKTATSALLKIENMCGNGLFVNVLLQKPGPNLAS